MKKLCIAAVVFTLTGCASIMTAEEPEHQSNCI